MAAGGVALVAARTRGALAAAGASDGPASPLVLNDASRLNPTPVARHVVRGAEPFATLVDALRAELKDAAAAGRPVAVGAARHSMGGQSLPRDGTALTLDSRQIEVDPANRLYRAAAGARWSDVIRTLDPLGLSPLVMQSNHDFGVASTFSVNAHGWPTPHGPFGSTVRSLRLMLADGSVVTCSPAQNADLFAHAMGGYGLVGIILDLDVQMTPNLLLEPRTERMPAEAFAERFLAEVHDPKVVMAYGRLSLRRRTFFEEALLTSYRPAEPQPGALPAATSDSMVTRLSNDVYRAQIGYETMKSLRWAMETRLGPAIASGIATRNTLMNEPVANLHNPDPRRTDILHEYFVEPARFGDFLRVCRDIIPKAQAEFINVTLRYVAADRTARLAFAPTERIAAVMSFSQAMTSDGEADMRSVTERLIEAVVAIGGTFYLPYRLHARRDQVARAYPNAAAFAARKRELDPRGLFRNALWQAYFA
ncbi:MAG: FAD-binding oxidoreductase [Methylobacteriaceae bacterium]|nr:FAD-binding oxidoreductase [Methylobacteriaceae bacterium]